MEEYYQPPADWSANKSDYANNSISSTPNPGSHASSICKVEAVLGVGHMGARALRPRRIVPFLAELAFKAAWKPQRVSAMMPKSRTWSKIGENE